MSFCGHILMLVTIMSYSVPGCAVYVMGTNNKAFRRHMGPWHITDTHFCNPQSDINQSCRITHTHRHNMCAWIVYSQAKLVLSVMSDTRRNNQTELTYATDDMTTWFTQPQTGSQPSTIWDWFFPFSQDYCAIFSLIQVYQMSGL